MTRIALIAAPLLILTAMVTLSASQGPTTFKSRVEAVRLDVSVMRGGQPVGGLSAADFSVTDNKVPQQVEVAVDPQPLSVLLVLDTSGSVAGERMAHLTNAASTLVTALHAGDRAALIRGPTSRRGHSRRLARRRAGCRPGSTRSAGASDRAVPGFMERLVKASGGREWQATASVDLQPLFTRALDEMRARYLLTFYPEGVAREGWHDLKVTLTRGRGDVTARPGYFVPRPN